MIIFPAIDIRGGKCVRLEEGRFDRETVFAENPADAARRWVEAGSKWLHIVDLDGARAGKPVNLKVVEEIARAFDVQIQLGGGIRTAACRVTSSTGRNSTGWWPTCRGFTIRTICRVWPRGHPRRGRGAPARGPSRRPSPTHKSLNKANV